MGKVVLYLRKLKTNTKTHTKMKKISLLAIACLALISCDPNEGKTENGGGSETSTNWWLRSQLAPEGVKSITETDEFRSTTKEYDRQGRPTSINEQWGIDTHVTTTFTYGSDGQLKSMSQLTQERGNENVTTTSYEYGNPGKYLPVMGNMGHLRETGLAAGLSKITEITNGDTTSVKTMTFLSDTQLQIVHEYGRWADTAYVKYQGAYPVDYYDGWWFYTGPISYQSNGMFLEYNEGFKAPGEQPANARTFTYRTDYDKDMLLSRYEEITPGDRTVSDYEYDQNGNMTKEVTNYYGTSDEYNSTSTRIYTYEFDSHGNWISRHIEYIESNSENKESYTYERTILYY